MRVLENRVLGIVLGAMIDETAGAAVAKVVRGPLMVREKFLVVRGEIWTLFAIFMFITLFHYIHNTYHIYIHINKIELL
jgi:hypothetical protein